MKNIIYLVLVVVLTSCNNNNAPVQDSIVIGETKNMNVIEFDKTFKGVWVGYNEINERYHSFDINGDGSDDFRLISSVDTVLNSISGSSEMTYAVYIGLEDYYSGKIQNTENKIFFKGVQRDTVYTGSGGNSIYWVYNYDCNEVLNSDEAYDYKFVKRVNADDVISGTNDEEWFNVSNRRLIYHSNSTRFSGQTYENYNFNCLNSSKNTTLYIPIQVTSNSYTYQEPRLGWIELEILEDNTIHLIRTAVQE